MMMIMMMIMVMMMMMITKKKSAAPVALIRFSKLKKSAKGSEATRPMNSRGFVMRMMILLRHNPL